MSSCQQLLCIADLEGCLENQFGTKQNITMCDQNTFNTIMHYLDFEPGNHVAFLGDYFDQGPHMVSSINGIANLKILYTNKVHIILGNRDLNKMRINIEKDMIEEKYTNVWTMWKKGLEGIDAAVPIGDLPRTEYLLGSTYGAPKLLEHLSTELEITREDALDLFGKIFSNVELRDAPVPTPESSNNKDIVLTDFIRSCRTLFNEGKIMEKVTVGEKNVLLSHGGSFNSHIFDNANLPKIESVISDEFTGADYFGKMEVCRNTLDRADVDVVANPDANIDTVIDAYNTFYKGVLEFVKGTAIKNVQNNPNYHMLQAMGLKGKNFVSPIESCIFNGGCNSDHQIKDIPDKLKNYLTTNKIDIISHGHIPFCGTVPLIYKNNGIIFVSNDVSNGNRPGYDGVETTLENIPLSCIGASDVGICSLNADGSLNKATNKIGAYKNSKTAGEPTNKDYYRGLVKKYVNYDGIPEHTSINKFFETGVNELGKPLMFKPMHKITNTDNDAAKEGGKKGKKSRKGRQSKKAKKGNRKTKKLSKQRRKRINTK